MKKYLTLLSAILLSYALLLTIISFCFLQNAVVVRPIGGLGNQIFQYAAAYSMAKAKNSQLYVIINQKSAKQGNVLSTDRRSGLLQFNIPKDHVVYKDSLFYITILNPLSRIIRPVKQSTFFAIKESSDKLPIFIKDFFESDIFFQDVEDDIRKIFDIQKIINPKLESTIYTLQNKDSVCVHVRRGDMCDNAAFFLDIIYQKKAMSLMSKLLENPEFYVFSDEVDKVKEELGISKNIHYISDNKSLLPIDDFALMANCANTIIASSTFSWWAGYLNKNQDKLVIAPYPFRNDVFINAMDDKEKGIWSFISYGAHLPKNWIALAYSQGSLSEKAEKQPKNSHSEIFTGYKDLPFNMYSSDLRQLNLCDEGDFRPGLCYLNKE